MTPTIERDRIRVEARLETLLAATTDAQRAVEEAMAYSALAGGKRLRAALALAFCRLACGRDAHALDFACAIEMVHAYSLIHDDLPCMDDDDLRRGKPSCHIQFGEATALLAGDGLLTYAFETMLGAATQPEVGWTRAGEAALCLARAIGVEGMIGGQVADLDFETHPPKDAASLYRMVAMKTGALIRASCRIGCILGDAGPALTERADIYADKIGLAFQIIDDILDVIGDEQTLGKPIGSDRESGKTTFAALYGLDRARQIALSLTEEAKAALQEIPGSEELLLLADRLIARTW